MAANRKLTPLLAQRTLQAVASAANLLQLHFTDGSVLSVKTALAEPAPPGAAPQPISRAQGVAQAAQQALTKAAPQAAPEEAPRTVIKVRQSGTVLNLDFTDGSTLAIALAEPASSVMLRGGDGTLQYAD